MSSPEPLSAQIDFFGTLTTPVYVIDGARETREALHALLVSMGMSCCPFPNCDEFLAELPSLEPAPIVLNVRVLGMEGIALLSKLDARGIKWPVIVVTGDDHIEIAVSAMKQGAMEYLESPFEPHQLRASLTLARERLRVGSVALDLQESARQRIGTLTGRELQVIRALIGGDANKQVAYQLQLSTRTVEMHRANALAKLGVKSIAEVVTLIAAAA